MTTQPTIVGYEVANRITNAKRDYRSSAAATAAMDKADRAYGAVVCSRRAIWSDQPEAARFA
jgi:hypothetical protein